MRRFRCEECGVTFFAKEPTPKCSKCTTVSQHKTTKTAPKAKTTINKEPVKK